MLTKRSVSLAFLAALFAASSVFVAPASSSVDEPKASPAGPTPGVSPVTTESTPESSAPGAPEKELSVLTYNVNWLNGGNVHGVLLDYIRAEQPDVITLNELCEHSFDSYADELADLGYAANFQRNNWSFNCNGGWGVGGDQGAAVFVAGGAREDSAQNFAHIGQGVPCITSDTTPPVRACSVHLDSKPKVAMNELDDLRSIIAEPTSVPLVLGGDFNLEVSNWENEEVHDYNAKMQDFYRDFHELDMNSAMCRDSQPAEYEGRFGGACTMEHPDQGKKKIDYAFVDNEHFTVDGSGEVPTIGPCSKEIRSSPGLPEREAVPCSDHKPLAGTATFNRDGFGDAALTLWRDGISLDSEFDGNAYVAMGSSMPTDSIRDAISAALGSPAYEAEAADAAPECSDEVDTYLVWGNRQDPDLALATGQTDDGPGLVGYRLYEDVDAISLADHATIGDTQTDLPSTFVLSPITLTLDDDTDGPGVGYTLDGGHPYPDLGALDSDADDAEIIERGAGNQCRLDTLIEDPLVEPLPDGTWTWELSADCEDRLDGEIFGCSWLAWEGVIELDDDGAITGEGSLDWKETQSCALKAVGELAYFDLSASQSVTVEGHLEGNELRLNLEFGPPEVQHEPVPDCNIPNEDDPFNPSFGPEHVLKSFAEFENFLTIPDTVTVTSETGYWDTRPLVRVETKVSGVEGYFGTEFECANSDCS